jgi:hypothetical protein
MIPKNLYNVSSIQACRHRNSIIKIDGYYRSATAQAWLQVFDNNVAAANGDSPLKQEPINGTSAFYFEFKRGELVVYEGCFVGISSTEGSYTALADSMDISIELSDPDLPATISYIGDLVTPVGLLQAWSEASGIASPKSLVAIEVIATTTDQYLMVFSYDAAGVGQGIPLAGRTWLIKANVNRTGVNKLNFGEFGMNPFTVDGQNDPSPGTKRYGCTIVVSATAPIYGGGSSELLCIKAEYRTAP